MDPKLACGCSTYGTNFIRALFKHSFEIKEYYYAIDLSTSNLIHIHAELLSIPGWKLNGSYDRISSTNQPITKRHNFTHTQSTGTSKYVFPRYHHISLIHIQLQLPLEYPCASLVKRHHGQIWMWAPRNCLT